MKIMRYTHFTGFMYFIVLSAALNDLQADTSSLGDIMEESDWEVESEVGVLGSSGSHLPTKGSAQAEKEIR